MKVASVILAVILLSSCSSMGMTGSGGGTAGYWSSSPGNSAYSRLFDPNDPYHGG